MNLKEIIITSLIASILALITGIILVHYEKRIDISQDTAQTVVSSAPSSHQPSTPVPKPPTTDHPLSRRLKALEIPNPSITVTLWFNNPEQTQFSTAEKITLYYQIKEIAPTSPCARECYFTLFNLSPTGKLSILSKNEPIEPDNIEEKGLRLEAGQEYFKAIITSQPITSWLSFLNSDITEPSQHKTLLATYHLSIIKRAN